MHKTLLILALALLSHLGFAQVKFLEESQNPGTGQVDELSWMTGYWIGEGFGGVCEEMWSPVQDGRMVGTFRYFADGKTGFTEYMRIVPDGESFSLVLKHFNPDGSGWEKLEDWTTFKLVKVGENTVWFHGLTIERVGDELILQLAMTENGERTIEELRYQRKKL